MSNTGPLISKQELLITLVCLLPLCLFAVGAYWLYQSKDTISEAFTLDTGEESEALDIEDRCNISSLLAKYTHASSLTGTKVSNTSQNTNNSEEKPVSATSFESEVSHKAFEIAFGQYFIVNIDELERVNIKPTHERLAYREQIRTWLHDESQSTEIMTLFDELKLTPREIQVGVLAQIYLNDGFEYTSSQFNQSCEALVLREAFDNKRIGKLNDKGTLLDKVGDN